MEHNKIKTIIEDGVKYETYLSPDAREVISDISLKASLAMEQGDLQAQDIIETMHQAERDRENLVKKEELEYQRTLRREEAEEKRAGYISASILLYFVFIFGILIATALLIFKN